MPDHLVPRDLHLNKLGKGPLAMLHTKFQASKPNGSEKENFLIFFYVFIWFEPRTSWQGAMLDPETFN